MRKLVKAAAALTAGCMLLSTSAFAAGTLTGTPAVDTDDLIKVTVANLGVGQSTILALKGDYTEIPSDLSAEDFAAKILYIDQMPAENDAASYTINPGTYEGDVSIFAGGTNQTEASFLGKVSTVKVINPESIAIEGATDGQELEIGDEIELTAVIAPNGAEGTIVWSVSEEGIVSVVDGKVTALAAGSVDVTATIEGTQIPDSVSLTVKAAAPAYTLGDVTGDGIIDGSDVLAIINHFLKGTPFTGAPVEAGEVTGDGIIDGSDVLAVINNFLKGTPFTK